MTATVDRSVERQRLVQEDAAAWEAYREAVDRQRPQVVRQQRFSQALATMTRLGDHERAHGARAE